MKRKLLSFDSVCNFTRSKKTKVITNWISATKTRNYMLNDTLVDWLELHYNSNQSTNLAQLLDSKTPVSYKDNKFSKVDNFTKFIIDKGVEFEEELVKFINNTKLKVVYVSNTINDDNILKTIELMKKGIPIIHSAPVRNYINKTQGIIDLLVRSDYLYKLIDVCPLTDEEIKIPSPNLNKPYHYVVIDIKFTTLPLRSDGKHLLNSGNFPAYKSQCLIYNQAVGQIQGYTSQYAFILGRRWTYTKKIQTYNNISCLNRLGTIDYKNVDNIYIINTKKALQWITDNKQNGHLWSVNPPTRKELYPNMSHDSGKWQKEKEEISNNIKEISSIWYCSYKHRNIALDKGINNWGNPKCTSFNLGIHGKRSSTIDAILNINRQTLDKIRPKKMGNTLDWKKNGNEMFVDFETLSDIFCSFKDLPYQHHTNMIFMIGVYYKNTNTKQLEYKNFICTKNTPEEEYRIMNEFNTFVKLYKNPKLWYWHAENSFWKKAENNLYERSILNKDTEKTKNIEKWVVKNWTDMCVLFKTEQIVIKDCFNYGLKSISGNMKKHNLINTEMNSICNSGMSAMISAYNCYQTSDVPINSSIMKDIEKYNNFDCQVLYDIITYLRLNHT